MAAAHFNRSNCHTVPTILSSFDVGFKGLQSCQQLSSDTSTAINWEPKARQTSWCSWPLCFSITQDQTDIFKQEISAAADSERESFQGLLEGKHEWFRAGKYSAGRQLKVQHTHTHTPTNALTVMEGDGRRWMVRSGWYDCTVVREDKRETDELPSTSRLMSGGLR